MNLQDGNRASSSSTRGCTVIPPPDRVPLLPRGHCEAQLYLVIAKRVPLLSLRGAQPFPVIARSAATKQSPSKGIVTPCIQRGAGLAMTDVVSLRGASSLSSLRGPKGRSNLLDEGDSGASLAMTIWANESWHSQLLRTGR